MKGTLSNDGESRVNVRLERRLSLEDLATHYISNRLLEISGSWSVEQTVDWFRMEVESEGQREIMYRVKSDILLNGVVTPAYRVSDQLSSSGVEVRIVVENAIAKKIRGLK